MEAVAHKTLEVIPNQTGTALYVGIASLLFILLHVPVV